jgi:hypothetical protein
MSFWRETSSLIGKYALAAACFVPAGIAYALFRPGRIGVAVLLGASLALAEIASRFVGSEPILAAEPLLDAPSSAHWPTFAGRLSANATGGLLIAEYHGAPVASGAAKNFAASIIFTNNTASAAATVRIATGGSRLYVGVLTSSLDNDEERLDRYQVNSPTAAVGQYLRIPLAVS